MVGIVQLAEHRIVVPGVVGSSPLTHPRKRKGDLLVSFSFSLGWVMGLEEGGLAVRQGKKHASDMFFSPGESPIGSRAQSARTVKCCLSIHRSKKETFWSPFLFL